MQHLLNFNLMMGQLRIVLIFITLALLQSCESTIWDDRMECPSVMSLNLDHIPKEIEHLHLWFYEKESGVLIKDTIQRQQLLDDYNIVLNRKLYNLYVWGNVKEDPNNGENNTLDDRIQKKANQSADSLYFYSKTFNITCDKVLDTISLNKEFVTINASLVDLKEGYGNLRMEFIGDASGYFIDKRLILEEGRVISEPSKIMESMALFEFRVTRQYNIQNMKLMLYEQESGELTTVGEFPIGEWMANEGYDMEGLSLSDINIEIKIPDKKITIKTNDWIITLPIKIEF